MNGSPLPTLLVSLAAAFVGVSPTVAHAAKKAAATQPTTQSAEESEAQYEKTIDKRAADVVALLELTDQAKSARVHDVIVAQYRALRDWHEANDAKLKAAAKHPEDAKEAAGIRDSLKALHDQFLAKLSEDLTPEQVEKVKDKMTYGKVQFTYAGYLHEYPDLTDEDKAKVLELLKEAREQAMDGGSSEEKTAIFTRYKGKINNYLSTHGHQPAKAAKAGKASPPATEPASEAR